MRVNLQVPFAEKDHAKGLGARWDPARKVWYVENKEDLTPFVKWMPGDLQKAAPGGDPARAPGGVGGAAKPKSAAPALKPLVGSAFVEYARVCDCLPWDACEKCAALCIQPSVA